MNTLPHYNCDCWRLTWPLAGEKLPDHICPKTAATTIYYGQPIPGAELTPDGGWPVYYRSGDNWGTPPRQLALVIREWAQEAPSRTLANLLRNSWEWPLATSWIYGDFVRWQRRYPDAPISDWIEDSADDRRYAALLWRHRLPGTAGTLRFLRACAAHEAYHRPTNQGGRTFQATEDGGAEEVFLPEPWEEEARFQAAFDAVLAQGPEVLPSRGALVTTLVFARTGPIEEYGVRYDPDPWFHVDGSAEFVTGPMFEVIGNVVLKHQEWLRTTIGHHHPLAEPRAIHRAKSKTLPSKHHGHDYYDYVKCAVDLARDQLVRADEDRTWLMMTPERLQDRIDGIITHAYKIAYKRRKDNQVDTKVPHRWREEARSKIMEMIGVLRATG